MSGEIVNLRQARKRKARAEAEAKAADNRVRFGRTKVEKALGDARRDLEARRIEGHRLAGSPAEGEPEDDQRR